MKGLEVFIIEGFEYSGGIFTAKYQLDGVVVSERVDFSEVEMSAAPRPELLRLLTLACSLSYYKASKSVKVEILFGLTHYERTFFEKLVLYGLAEYAFLNELPEKLEPQIVAETILLAPVRSAWNISDRPLVAVGGGKDSVVSIELLKAAGKNPVLFSVNGFAPIDRCIAVSGCESVRIYRTLDPELFKLNKRGAPNGHIPVTAINSLIGLIVADAIGLGSVIMSNESSASSGNIFWPVMGIEVNHQWSKGLDFEDLLRSSIEAAGFEADRYFSLLRPLREIDVAAKFANFEEYFSSFTSCNRNFTIDPATRGNVWCSKCAKCLFVFLILAPFIRHGDLVRIFGVNPLAESSNESTYEEILGIRGIKPFECVGEFGEAAEALAKISHDPEWATTPLIFTLLAKVPESQSNYSSRVSRIPAEFFEVTDVF